MRMIIVIVIIGLIVIGAACAERPRVAQGIVSEYDPKTKSLVLVDANQPGESLVISLENAEMGAPPAMGDQVRVSYRTKGDRAIAVRVMHISSRGEHAE